MLTLPDCECELLQATKRSSTPASRSSRCSGPFPVISPPGTNPTPNPRRTSSCRGTVPTPEGRYCPAVCSASDFSLTEVSDSEVSIQTSGFRVLTCDFGLPSLEPLHTLTSATRDGDLVFEANPGGDLRGRRRWCESGVQGFPFGVPVWSPSRSSEIDT
jgi:hypothetical protein